MEDLPEENELLRYRQRNFVPSHLLRLGKKLFPNQRQPPIRKRIIDAQFYGPPERLTHPNARRVRPKGELTKESLREFDSRKSYQKWIADRQQLRADLDQLGATKRWLLSKNCTPMEVSLLKKQMKSTVQGDAQGEGKQVPESSHHVNHTRVKLRREIDELERSISSNHDSLAAVLLALDKRGDHLLAPDVVLKALHSLGAPVPDSTLHKLCLMLVNATGVEKMIDYSLLFHERLADLVLQHSLQQPCSSGGSPLVSNPSPDRAGDQSFSTLTGRNGVLAQESRKTALQQFKALIAFCQSNGIVLDQELARKALLSPVEHTRSDCMSQISQPGSLLCHERFVHSEDTTDSQEGDPHTVYGWQHKQVRGPHRAKLLRLSTGMAKVKAKTDCWLTFEEFQQLTESIRSRPEFCYKYHGLAKYSAFWTNAVWDKLRQWYPQTRACSARSIFHPVTHQLGPIPNRQAWPENTLGHVQLGPSLARTRKSYCL